MIFSILISLLSVLGFNSHFKNTSAKIVVPALTSIGQKHTVDADFFIMKMILINSPKYGLFHALVDDDDFETVNTHHWNLVVGKNTHYAYTFIKHAKGVREHMLMHRLVTNAKKGEIIDHADRNGLNNQKNNLRVATPSENNVNRVISYNKTGFRGVSYDSRFQSYYVFIHNKNKKIHCGTFINPVDAAKRYNEVATEIYGEFAILNPISADIEDYYKDIKRFRFLKSSNNKTGFKGVAKHDKSSVKPYYAYINHKKRYNFLGSFSSAVEAAMAYNNAAISFKQAEYRVKKIIYKFPDAYVFGKTPKGAPLHPLAAAVWQKKLFNFRPYHL